LRDSTRWDPARYRRDAAFVAELGAPLVELLAPRPGERILDVGCGDGALTERLAARGCDVVGVDSSPEQVAAARARGFDARLGHAERLAFDAEFDAVFSNAALHWVHPPAAAATGMHRALRAGGRLVAELGGAGNVASVREALHRELVRHGVDPAPLDPWYFPTADEYRGLLESHGFRIEHIALFPRPTPLPGQLAEWLALFAQPFLDAFTEDARREVMGSVCRTLRPRLQRADGTWVMDYVRLRVRARRT